MAGVVFMKKDSIIFALGFFDGVHLGHQALLSACRELALERGCRAGVVTFLGHPDEVIRGEKTLLINTPEDRRRLLNRYGVEEIVEIPFCRELMNMPWREFYALLREQYHGEGFVCGEDFRFGFRGEGTAELLAQACQEEGLPCRVIPQQLLNGIRVSSTYIRTLLQQGQLEQAQRFLGHPHILTGRVISGQKLGRQLGTPTANVSLPEGLCPLPFGVYICRARTRELNAPAVTNVGIRPTVEGDHVTVEPWILDYEGDLYGQELTLEFHRYLRPERKFPSLEDLKNEILKNGEQTRKFFENP